MQTKSHYVIAISAVLILGLSVAVTLGFISADSWEYLSMAYSLRHGEGCSVGGTYFAVLPCGYPLVIALTAPSGELASLVFSSKFTNLLLLASAFFLLEKEHRNVFVPALITVSPVTMAIYQYTWSENLFVFAIAGSLFSISRIFRYPNGQRHVVLLALFLVIGCAARYFFGPFAALMFCGVVLVYGRTTAVRVFPAFFVAGVFFLAYQWFNVEMTGYASGMPRITAPESVFYLVFRYLNALAHIAVYLFVSLFLLLAISTKYWRFSPRIDPDDESRPYLFLVWLGAAFLVLAFVLRALTHFDMYGTRTVGFGLVLLSAGAIGLFIRPKRGFYPVLGVLCCGVFSIAFGNGSFLPRLVYSIWNNGYRPPLVALRDYHAPRANADLIIELSAPDISPAVSVRALLYYPATATVLSFAGAPFRKTESLDEFKRRARRSGAKTCLIDFHPFPSVSALRSYVDASYVVDLRYDSEMKIFSEIRRPVFDPSIGNYLLSRFEPGRYVDCSDIILP